MNIPFRAIAGTAGSAFFCDASGEIETMVRSDPDLFDHLAVGERFIDHLDPSSVDKATQMLVDVRMRGAVFGVELVVPRASGPRICAFAGFSRGESILLVGALSRTVLELVCDDVEGIDHGMVRKGQKRLRPLEDSDPYQVLDNLTEVNNELAAQGRALQRENRRLNLRLGTEAERFTILATAVQEIATLIRECTESSLAKTLGTPPVGFGFPAACTQLLSDLAQLLHGTPEGTVAALVKRTRPVPLMELVTGAAALYRTWWPNAALELAVTDHGAEIIVATNRASFCNALALLLTLAARSAMPGDRMAVDVHLNGGSGCIQVALTSTAAASPRFRLPRAIKRVMGENRFKTTVMRGSQDRLTLLLRHTDEEFDGGQSHGTGVTEPG